MRAPPGQVLVLVEVLEEGGLTDELLLLTHLLAGASRLGQLDLQGAEGGPHHLAVAEVLTTQRNVTREQTQRRRNRVGLSNSGHTTEGQKLVLIKISCGEFLCVSKAISSG